MSPHPTTTAPDDRDAEEIAHYREVLRKLIDMGADMACHLHQQAIAPAAAGGIKPDLTISFDRITRTIRRTILLARKLAEPVRPRTETRTPDRTTARKRIIREVEDQIERHAYRDNVDPDALRAELGDRLDSPDLEDDLETLSLDEIITNLCSDLGVGKMPNARINRWKRRTPEDIVNLARRATPPFKPPGCRSAPLHPNIHQTQRSP